MFKSRSKKATHETPLRSLETYLIILLSFPDLSQPIIEKNKPDFYSLTDFANTLIAIFSDKRHNEELIKITRTCVKAELTATEILRIKELRGLLEYLKDSDKIKLMDALDINFLPPIILRSQIIAYQERNGSTTLVGAYNAVAGSVGLAGNSSKKARFLQTILSDFSEKKILRSAATSTILPTPNDVEWQTLLCNIILPGLETLKALSWLPSDYLIEIGVAEAIKTVQENRDNASPEIRLLTNLLGNRLVTHKSLSPEQEMPLHVELQIQDKLLIRIKRKTDGKNKGNYDGAYVIKDAYQAKLTTSTQTEINAYQKGEIFFLKMFPSGKKRTEGFAEGFVGNFIAKLLDNGFINERYRECFALASMVAIPGVGAALIQPFALETQLLYQCGDESLKKKPFWVEAAGMVAGRGYERYLEHLNFPDLHGLSLIVMIMIVLGNYSVHSGNILVSITSSQTLFTGIDNGAALRNFMSTGTQTDIWTPLEVQELNIAEVATKSHKRYMQHYKTIPGFIELCINHAAELQSQLCDSDRRCLFEELIRNATQETYHSYLQAVCTRGEDQSEKINQLLEYFYGGSGLLSRIKTRMQINSRLGLSNDVSLFLSEDISLFSMSRIFTIASNNTPDLTSSSDLDDATAKDSADASRESRFSEAENTTFYQERSSTTSAAPSSTPTATAAKDVV